MQTHEPFDATYTISFHGITQTDGMPTVTPTVIIDKLGDLLDRLVNSGSIEGFDITFRYMTPEPDGYTRSEKKE